MARIRSHYNALGHVGWLFADGLLGLAMWYLVAGTFDGPLTQAAPALPTPTPAPTDAAAPLPPTPAPTPGPAHTCLDQAPVTARVQVAGPAPATASARTARLAAIRAQVSAALGDTIGPGREAGMVLTFGGARGGLPSRGNDLAKDVNEALAQLPAFSGAAYREFHDLDVADGTADVAVYFLSACRPS